MAKNVEWLNGRLMVTFACLVPFIDSLECMCVVFLHARRGSLSSQAVN